MDEKTFYKEAESILYGNILSFWQTKMVDLTHGGFFGEITGHGEVVVDAPKGAILNSRILWTFSAAYRLSRKKEYLELAMRAKKYLIKHFYDHQFGGVYWSLRADGVPLDTKKQVYALGFAIYGLSEFVRATDDEEALDYAVKLYRSIEKYSFDPQFNGYFEAMTREWGGLNDVRLSEKDANEKKTTNTHLHILEAYTNLYRVWPSKELDLKLKNLIRVFLEHIYDPVTGHLKLFFNEKWESRDAGFSYGHDIEASWLLLEGAIELGYKVLADHVKSVCMHLAKSAMEGLQPDGSMIYERHANGHTVTDRHWWVQAETVIGLIWLWYYHGRAQAFSQAVACWEYIKENLIDYEGGEWWWAVKEDGTKDLNNDKAGFWKCPYHNSRMCLEVMFFLKEYVN
ncbi:MAG: AGE family epimerase/isomerase [Mangrovibacterium sp.]